MAKVVSVTVAYQPDPDLLALQLRALASQVSVSVVVDNGSDNAADWHLRLAEETGARVLPLPGNLGIAAAQNVGIRLAREVGASHVLLMDHDSIPEPGMVDALLTAEIQLVSKGVSVAALGPVCIDRRTGSLSGFVRLQGAKVGKVGCSDAIEGLVEADFLIASGSLIPVAALDVVGLMNEGYFIDHVDTEWCLRARDKALRIVGVCAARLNHRLGDSVVRVWVGYWREVPLNSPIRNYYMFRNTVLMMRFTPMSWVWRRSHLFRLLQYVVFSSIAVAPRWKRIGLMAKGVWHGLQGRSGPLSTVIDRTSDGGAG
ncbi:rhamnosyltransferase family protein [Collimonas arenae]|uniref:Rhamnosyltransferase family protein n=1 Tax=Collimonas arenae TaxID=279058 RepID=A0A127QEV4_9BURK|nr:glycosyltransferase family 2 protein [Collimonas arenae]AMO98700.1 rhamnosyltransferase family protein [Collimonas arenae]AMP08590.1 rhamnosyltransferase family protein [Collimonas arenae]